MAVNITTEGEKYLWGTCSLVWKELPKTWREAEKSYVGATANENLSVKENDKKATNYQRLFAASFDITDSDAERVKFKRTIKEMLSVSEVYWDSIAFALSILEQLNLVDEKIAQANKPLNDNFGFNDSYSNGFITKYSERFDMLDEFCRQAIFFMGVIEDVGVDEFHTGCTKYNRGTIERIGVSDTERHKSKFRPIYIELLGFQETYLDNISFNLGVAENLALEDLLGNGTNRPIVEKIGLHDDEKNIVGKLYFEDINIDEFIKTYRPIIRKFYEMLGIEEKPLNSMTIAKAEDFGVRDAMVRACEGVLSDIIIKTSGMSFEEFTKSVDAPPLYYPFVDFKVGEYEYEKAIVKLKLSTTSRESLPSIVACVMHIDIPDTIDKGTAEITGIIEPTKVYFNRHYYNPPEVNVTLKNGTTANGYIVPNIVSTNGKDERGRYFEVELLNSSNQRVAGVISWASTGY